MPDHAIRSSLPALATAVASAATGEVPPREQLAGTSSLATGVAADLGSLLAPIQMATGLLGERVRDAHDGPALAMLEDAARRGEALMRQLLALAGDADRPSTVIRPARLLEDVRRLVAETFPRAIDVVVEAQADAAVLHGEPGELHQVLMTFCLDAQESMPAGGRLTLKSESFEIGAAEPGDGPAAPRPGRFVVFTVHDTGVGTKTPLPNRLPPRPPDVVARARAAADAIVLARGGFVESGSEAGRGTTVRIHLPAYAAGSTQHEVRPPAPPRGRDELVLVVDDEASVRAITEQVLRAFGYRVVVATSGTEAVAVYARYCRDIAAVLLDIVAPVMDGASTIRALRTIDRDVQIVAASASPGGGPALAPVAPAVAAFLPKPYTAAAMLHIVRAVLDRRPVADAAAAR